MSDCEDHSLDQQGLRESFRLEHHVFKQNQDHVKKKRYSLRSYLFLHYQHHRNSTSSELAVTAVADNQSYHYLFNQLHAIDFGTCYKVRILD